VHSLCRVIEQLFETAEFVDLFRLIAASNYIGQNQLISRLCLCLLNCPGGKLKNRVCR